MQKDMMFFPDEKYELPLYGNQWIPLGVKTTLQEKVRLSAALDKACNGGSIAHINIDKPFNNFDTAWKMLNYGGTIIIKFGRYVPGSVPIQDPVLGVTLASSNQYAERL